VRGIFLENGLNLITVARAARALALGVWLGGIVMAFIAAPIVFDKLKPDRAKAGEIVGAMLHTTVMVKVALAVVALGAEAALIFSGSAGGPSGWRRYAPAAFLLAAIATTAFTSLWLEPKIAALRDQIGDFSEATANSPQRVEFRKLHGMSMGLLLLEAILILVALVAGLL
jgi:hypothetical protein